MARVEEQKQILNPVSIAKEEKKKVVLQAMSPISIIDTKKNAKMIKGDDSGASSLLDDRLEKNKPGKKKIDKNENPEIAAMQENLLKMERRAKITSLLGL